MHIRVCLLIECAMTCLYLIKRIDICECQNVDITLLLILKRSSFFWLQSLLCDPNPNSPANSEAARMFSENKREYNRRVREIVEQSWTAD